jgi:diacylglycerol kinase
MRKFLTSLQHATSGIGYLLKERNFKIQLAMGSAILILGAVLKLEKNDYLWLLFCTFMVIILEGVNTVVEKIADILHPYYDERVRVLKDVSASIVLLGSTISVLVGLSILLQAIFGWHFAVGIVFGIIIVFIFFSFGFLGVGGGKE